MPKEIRALLLAAVCAWSGGCVPAINRYLHVVAPEAVYLNSVCYGEAGPHSIAYYPYHGIFISIELSEAPISEVFAFHIPKGSVIAINDKEMRIHGISDSGPFESTLSIRATRQGGFANGATHKIYGTRSDPYTSPDNFGPLAGGQEQGKLLWYLYMTNGSIPRGTIRGTITLPSLTIDGHHYDPQTLNFVRKSSFGVQPVNC